MFKNFNKILLILGFFLPLFLFGCNNKSICNEGENYPLIITDSTKQTITINNEPEKIVSLSPVITEIVSALGDGNKIVGRVSLCDYPEAIKKIEVIGNLMSVNIEKIVELRPDLVICSGYVNDNVRKTVENAGIKVVAIYTKDNLEGTYKDIETIGKILNSSKEASKIVADIKNKVSEIKCKVAKSSSKPTVYYLIGFGAEGEFTATGDTFINELIKIAGGYNIAADGKNWSFSLEKLVERNPELIIYSNNLSKEELLKNSNFKELTAVKAGKIYTIDSNLIERTGPRLAEGLEYLAKIIHPELFK